MPRDSAVLAEVAGAILDGTSIDWASAESSADAVERSLLDTLRVVAAVADVHRRLPVRYGRLARSQTTGGLRPIHSTGALGASPRAGTGRPRHLWRVHRAWDSRSIARLRSSSCQPVRLRAHTVPARLIARGVCWLGFVIPTWSPSTAPNASESSRALDGIHRRPDAGTDAPAGTCLRSERSRCHRHSSSAVPLPPYMPPGLLHRDIKAHNVTRCR